MGYQLYRHILDHAPADLTSSERFVLAVIADDANDATRTGYPGMDVICHRTGMTPGTVQKALWRLGQRGIDVRVPLGVDSKGRRVYAVKGKRTTYRIPRIPERDDLPSAMGRPQSGHSEQRSDSDLPIEPVWPDSDPTMARPESDMARPQSGPSPQVPSGSPHIEDARDDDTDPQDGLFGEPPKTEKPKKAKKAAPAPEHFDVTPELRQWADANVPTVDLDFETQKFLNHHGAKGTTFKDWTKAWRNWMLTARKYAEERQQKQGPLRVVGGTRTDAVPEGYWDGLTEQQLKERIL